MRIESLTFGGSKLTIIRIESLTFRRGSEGNQVKRAFPYGPTAPNNYPIVGTMSRGQTPK